MFDIKWIRDNPQTFDSGLASRRLEARSSELIELDKVRRAAETEAQKIQAERNKLAKEIGRAKAAGEDAGAIIELVSRSKRRQAAAEERARAAGEELSQALSAIPNLPAADVPEGVDEDDNELVRTWGEPGDFDFPPKEHFQLGEALGLMDFETAAKMSGSRFVILCGALARMERALASFMLDLHTTEHGLTEVNPPALVRDSALYGTGQLPKFGDDLFRTDNGYWLIPTAEVPLANMAAGKILDEQTLPRRYVAMTWCFRSEAGSAGKDTRGMIRQHQFSKVEMVSVTTPEQSDDELERMTACAEQVLKRLELPYRVVKLCAGDMGFGALRTYDLEVWLPGQGRYREISSCSSCGDFQARRMQARCRPKGQKNTRFVHTLNGSGLAIGRTLVAIMENYQRPDGAVLVPRVLQPYMGGLQVIAADA